VIHAETDLPCGLLRRLAAIFYDLLLLTAVFFAITWIVLLARRGAPITPETLWYQGLLVAVSLFFYSWFWTHRGQTLGMRAWKIRVVRADGGTLSWRDAGYRWLAAWLAALPAGLGFLWGLVDRDRLCWHDRLSGTRLRIETRRPG
jgi:uncharacterized RDD family membrane protein YckC